MKGLLCSFLGPGAAMLVRAPLLALAVATLPCGLSFGPAAPPVGSLVRLTSCHTLLLSAR
jgi:hypothetical protein